jgi:hypothetical protein
MPDYVWKESVRGSYATPYRLSLSGLDRIRGAIKGRFRWPPIRHLFGVRPVEAGVGTCTFLTPASPWLQNLHGGFTGGIYALAADVASCSNTSGGKVNPLDRTKMWVRRFVGRRRRLVRLGLENLFGFQALQEAAARPMCEQPTF